MTGSWRRPLWPRAWALPCRSTPQFYAFRWITLLLTQEFPFPDVVRLWDALLAAPQLACQTALLRLCTAMLLHVRQPLLEASAHLL